MSSIPNINPTVTFQTTVTGPNQQAIFTVSDIGTDALKRALGCAIVTLLPPQGLDEVLAWLKDALEFYSYQAPTAELVAAHGTATVTGTGERPVLVLPEET